MGRNLIQLLTVATAVGFSSAALGGSAELVLVTDSLGNQQTNSIATNGNPGWPDSVAQPVIINVGDSITFEATAQDDEDEILEYRFMVQRAGGSFDVEQDWSNENTWLWEVSSEDFGIGITVAILVRDSDGLDEFGSEGGDDYAYAIYDVADPDALVQPLITKFRDSLGNETRNSISSNQQLGWPDSVRQPVQVNIGDRLTMRLEAESFDDQELEYKFAVQPPSGSFETIQDWSSESSVVWTVQASQFGSGAFFFAAVRNKDGKHLQGEFAGDDYVDVEYFVNDPNASYPPILVSVRDSRGNLQTNSFGDDNDAQWPNGRDNVSVILGNVVDFVAEAIDSDSNSLEYLFMLQRVGGSFEIQQDWSSSNNWTWEVSKEDFGRELTIAVAVRDDDGREQFGVGNGDDYTYLTYRVTVDISGAINLLL